MKVGDKIKFKAEKQRYTIQAMNERYLICTKPFNPMHTVLYTIVDLEKQIRGRENLVFGMGAETTEQCEEMLERLTIGTEDGMKSEISHRNYLTLDIENICPPPSSKQ